MSRTCTAPVTNGLVLVTEAGNFTCSSCWVRLSLQDQTATGLCNRAVIAGTLDTKPLRAVKLLSLEPENLQSFTVVVTLLASRFLIHVSVLADT